MRYVLIDRITRLEPGRAIRVLKNVTFTDELVTRHPSGMSALPSAMVLEAMAQAGGALVAASIGCRRQPMLAKVQPFHAYGLAVPGDQIAIDVLLEDLREEGCRMSALARIAGDLVADATIYLALIDANENAHPGTVALARRTLAGLFPEWADVFGGAELAV